MSVGEIITYVMLAFAIIGAADRCIGCKFGPGKCFEEGFQAMGPLALTMIGITTVAPLLAEYLAPVLTPVCEAIGIDPSIIAGMFLANDCGGWPLALGLAQDPLIGKFSGSAVGSIMGCTLLFTIPFAFASVTKEKRKCIAKGLIIGLITVPVGCFFSGLFMGIGLLALLRNLLPLILLAVIFILGLVFFEQVAVKVVTVFGYIITALVTVALVVAMVIKLMCMDVPGLTPFDESLLVIGNIAIVLAGAFTLLFFVRKLLGKTFSKVGDRLQMNEVSVAGLVTTLVSSIPMFTSMKDMDERGAVLNTAWAVCASFALGDHLAFTASTDSSLIVPLILGKIIGGGVAIVLALAVTRRKNAPLN